MRRYILVLEHYESGEDLPALRRLLKALARRYGFRCSRVEPFDPPPGQGSRRRRQATKAQPHA